MKRAIRSIAVIVIFVLCFFLAQSVLTPKFLKSSTGMMSGIYSNKTGDLDVLLIGSSQLYCSFDAQRLTEKYGLRSYDIGSGGMPLSLSYFYLQEASKYKHPSTVVIEVGTIFTPNSEIGEDVIVYTFVPTRYSKEKETALRSVVDDEKEIFELLYCPLLKFHSRWNTLEVGDIIYPFFPLLRALCGIPALKELQAVQFLNAEFFENRGFLSQSSITPVDLAYYSENCNEEQNHIPDESIVAIDSIHDFCTERNIKVVFVKAPTAEWSRANSECVKGLMNQKGYIYIDLHDHLDEMGIDAKTDFYDSVHLNCYGAEKATDYIADYLLMINE